MHSLDPGPSPLRFRRTLAMLAAVLACAVGGVEIGPTAEAASVAPAKVRAHGGHRCKCGMDCGTTCCCAPNETVEPPPAAPAKPSKATAQVGSAPCVRSAPCGSGSLPPSAGPLVRWFEPADRLSLGEVDSPRFRALLAPPDSDRAGGLTGSPVDEPPERLADA